MAFTGLMKKGFFMLLLIWLINFVLAKASIPYLVPIQVETISFSSFTSINFIISLLLYILIIGVAVEQIDKRAR